jgi:Putative peptidoglycan binding domain
MRARLFGLGWVVTLCLGVGGVVAAVPSAAASTPLCTGGAVVSRGSSGDLSVPVVVATTNPTCLIGDGLVGSHAAVRSLQRAMAQCYPSHLAPGFTVDGNWGPKTRQTLVNIQRVVSVSADGIYGPITRDHMNFPSADIANRCFHY